MDTDQRYCATCAFFEDEDDYGMGFCDNKQRKTLCGNPACKDFVELPETGEGLTEDEKTEYCSLTVYRSHPAGFQACLSCKKDSMPEPCRRLNEAAPAWEKEYCANCGHYRRGICLYSNVPQFGREYACERFIQKQ